MASHLRLRLLLLLAILALPAHAQLTESPATVERGTWLVEMDALAVSHDSTAGTHTTSVGVASTLLTTGLVENLDLQIGYEAYLTEKITTGGVATRTSGQGDFYLRSKWCFLPGEKFSAALLPYIKLPTNSGGIGNDDIEGGVIVPLETTQGKVTLSGMLELDFVRNATDDGYDTQTFVSLYAAHALTEKVGGYIETAVSKVSDGSPWAAAIGVGCTCCLTKKHSVDFAAYRGLGPAAADWDFALRFNLTL